LQIGFHRKGIDLQVLETSQGGSHPQKEPVLALLHVAIIQGTEVRSVLSFAQKRPAPVILTFPFTSLILFAPPFPRLHVKNHIKELLLLSPNARLKTS